MLQETCTYLVDTGKSESVEDGNEGVAAERYGDDGGEHKVDIDHAVDVDFRRHPEDQDRREETGEQRQRDWQQRHLTTSEEVLDGGAVMAADVDVVGADEKRNDEHRREHDVVERREPM